MFFDIFQKMDDSLAKLGISVVVNGMDHFLSQEAPEPLDQIQVGRIGGQEHKFNACVCRPILQPTTAIVACIIAYQIDRFPGVLL